MFHRRRAWVSRARYLTRDTWDSTAAQHWSVLVWRLDDRDATEHHGLFTASWRLTATRWQVFDLARVANFPA